MEGSQFFFWGEVKLWDFCQTLVALQKRCEKGRVAGHKGPKEGIARARTPGSGKNHTFTK